MIYPLTEPHKAIRQSFFRILFVFIGLVFFAGIIVPSNAPGFLTATSKTASSPFSIALQTAGWEAAPNLINVFIVTAILSSINSSIYIASRTLLSLARQGRAPRFFAKTTSKGVPVRAVVLSNFLGLISLINISAGAGKVFTYLISISGAATFIAWGFIGITHIRFRRAWLCQGHSLDELPFRAMWYPFGAYFVAGLNIFLVIIQGYSTLLHPWQPVSFVFSYLVLVLFVGLYLFWRFYRKTSFVKLDEVDLQYGRREYLDDTNTDEPEKKKVPFWVRVRMFILG
jgi:amino acid transporter